MSNEKQREPHVKITNYKSQIPNGIVFSFVIWVIGLCDFLVIWYLGFGIVSCTHAFMQSCFTLFFGLDFISPARHLPHGLQLRRCRVRTEPDLLATE